MPNKIKLRQTGEDYIIAKKDIDKALELATKIQIYSKNAPWLKESRYNWATEIVNILTGKDGGDE